MLRFTAVCVVGMVLGGVQAKALNIEPAKTKTEKAYQLDGKTVDKNTALMGAVQGKRVVVCEEYSAQMSKSGSISLKKK